MNGIVLSLKEQVQSLWGLLDPGLMMENQVGAVPRYFFYQFQMVIQQ